MKVLEIEIPSNISHISPVSILPSATGLLIKVTHFIRIKFATFGTDPYMDLPFTLFDSKVEISDVDFEQLIGYLPQALGFPYIKEIKKRDI